MQRIGRTSAGLQRYPEPAGTAGPARRPGRRGGSHHTQLSPIAADFAAKRIDRAEANRRLDAGFDRDTAMAAYRRFAAKGVFVTPTLNGSRIIAYLDRDDHSKDAGLAYIGPKLRKTYDWRIERAAKADAAAIASWLG